MELLKELLVCGLMLGGSFLMVLTGYGLLKFPDVLCRGHAQTKAMTLGVCSMLLALWVQLGTAKAGWALFFAMLAQIITIPVAGHMIALLAFQKRVPRYRQRKVAYHKDYVGFDLER
jgi:multicomponent Na+:H+ antiporter subunit G